MGNTGKRITLTLRQRNTTTNVLTGVTKPNVPGDPDYVAPVVDTVACPIDTVLVCPDFVMALSGADSITWELSIPRSVLNNPAFAKVRIHLWNDTPVELQIVTLLKADFTPTNYKTAVFPGLVIPDTYVVHIQYLDAADVEILACNNAASIIMDPVITWEGTEPICLVTPSCTLPAVYEPVTNTCQAVDQVPATPPSAGGGSPGIASGIQNNQWNNGGAQIFNPGYPLNGTGTVAAYLTVPHFWINGNFQWDATGRNFVDGRMNWAGVWEASNPVEWIGFVRRIDTPVAKTVYVAMSADNAFRFSLNGVLLVDCDTASGVITGGSNFNFWNIYPVTLAPGTNYIEMWAKNYGGPAGFAMEIYDMTFAQLVAATSQADLVVLFSTHDMVGQPFDLGTGLGWSCPATYSLDTTGAGDPVCRKVVSTPPSTVNTGTKHYNSRRRLADGVPDGYSEPNIVGGLGPVIPDVVDAAACPIGPPTTKSVFVVNETGGLVVIETDLDTYNFAPGMNGDIWIATTGIFINRSASIWKFTFLQSMPSTLAPSEAPNPETLAANNGTHMLNIDISTLNYVRVAVP